MMSLMEYLLFLLKRENSGNLVKLKLLNIKIMEIYLYVMEK